jgi:hypothetical protein
MTLSNVTVENIHEVAKLVRQQDFTLPDIDNCIIDKVVYINDKMAAYGIVKEMSEAIIIVNYEVPKVSRMKALISLLRIAVLGAVDKGHKQLHVFVKDEELAKLLEKKFNFIRSKDICLVRNL